MRQGVRAVLGGVAQREVAVEPALALLGDLDLVAALFLPRDHAHLQPARSVRDALILEGRQGLRVFVALDLLGRNRARQVRRQRLRGRLPRLQRTGFELDRLLAAQRDVDDLAVLPRERDVIDRDRLPGQRGIARVLLPFARLHVREGDVRLIGRMRVGVLERVRDLRVQAMQVRRVDVDFHDIGGAGFARREDRGLPERDRNRRFVPQHVGDLGGIDGVQAVFHGDVRIGFAAIPSQVRVGNARGGRSHRCRHRRRQGDLRGRERMRLRDRLGDDALPGRDDLRLRPRDPRAAFSRRELLDAVGQRTGGDSIGLGFRDLLSPLAPRFCGRRRGCLRRTCGVDPARGFGAPDAQASLIVQDALTGLHGGILGRRSGCRRRCGRTRRLEHVVDGRLRHTLPPQLRRRRLNLMVPLLGRRVRRRDVLDELLGCRERRRLRRFRRQAGGGTRRQFLGGWLQQATRTTTPHGFGRLGRQLRMRGVELGGHPLHGPRIGAGFRDAAVRRLQEQARPNGPGHGGQVPRQPRIFVGAPGGRDGGGRGFRGGHRSTEADHGCHRMGQERHHHERRHAFEGALEDIGDGRFGRRAIRTRRRDVGFPGDHRWLAQLPGQGGQPVQELRLPLRHLREAQRADPRRLLGRRVDIGPAGRERRRRPMVGGRERQRQIVNPAAEILDGLA